MNSYEINEYPKIDNYMSYMKLNSFYNDVKHNWSNNVSHEVCMSEVFLPKYGKNSKYSYKVILLRDKGTGNIHLKVCHGENNKLIETCTISSAIEFASRYNYLVNGINIKICDAKHITPKDITKNERCHVCHIDVHGNMAPLGWYY